MACAGLAACDRKEAPAKARQAAPAASLVGVWRATEPVRFAGEDLRTQTSAGQTDYRGDGSFRYRARLTVFGEKLPQDGLPFRVDATGVWRLQDNILTERFTAVTVTPEGANRTLNRLAKAMGAELSASPPNVSDVVEFDQARLTLRDRDSGQSITYAREPTGNR